MSDRRTRPVLLLDDGGELFNVLTALERILVELVASGDEVEEPYPNLGVDQLNAVHRVLLQVNAAESSPGVDLWDPTGRVEYCTLRVFCPLETDLDEIGRSLEEIRVAAGIPHPNYLREAVEDISQLLATTYVNQLDQAYRTLIVDADEEQRPLCELAVERTGKVILDVGQDAAYLAYIKHSVRVRGNDPLEWFLYLGPM